MKKLINDNSLDYPIHFYKITKNKTTILLHMGVTNIVMFKEVVIPLVSKFVINKYKPAINEL